MPSATEALRFMEIVSVVVWMYSCKDRWRRDFYTQDFAPGQNKAQCTLELPGEVALRND